MIAVSGAGLQREGSGVPADPPARPRRWLAIGAAYAAGAVPWSQIAAQRLVGADLRKVGTGTVSGTALYQVAGMRALVAAGVLEVAKGAVGPLLAGRRDPLGQAMAASAAVVGHNWSPWLRGAGGRGLSPAIGALGICAPAGSAALLAGMAGGRLAGLTGVGALAGDLAAVAASARLYGGAGAAAAGGVVAAMLAKRLTGNRRPERPRPEVWLWRLVADSDTPPRRARLAS